MFAIDRHPDAEKNLRRMVSSIELALEGEDDLVSGLSNVAAFIYAYTESINWAGFYIMKNGRLVLGPFQGLPACTRIEVGKGVCGTAVAESRVMLVPDVHAFPGHIACDGASNSELVVPIYKSGEVFGVLDIDSPQTGRFTPLEQQYFEQVAGLVGRLADRAE